MGKGEKGRGGVERMSCLVYLQLLSLFLHFLRFSRSDDSTLLSHYHQEQPCAHLNASSSAPLPVGAGKERGCRERGGGCCEREGGCRERGGVVMRVWKGCVVVVLKGRVCVLY